MTSRLPPDDPVLLDSVRLGEGLRLRAYPDPLTQAAPWTIGYGHTAADIGPGGACTADQAEGWLVSDLTDACRALDLREPWWRTMSLNRQRVLCEMAFNIGIGKLLGFHQMLLALQTQRYDHAADEMLDSAWAGQVHRRAHRLAAAMRAG